MQYLYWFKLARFVRVLNFRYSTDLILLLILNYLNVTKKIKNRITDFTKLTILLAIIFHSITCCWILIGKSVNGSWIDYEVNVNNEDLANKGKLYLASFYFVTTTLATIGYGDLKGYTSMEYLVCMGIELVGIGVFALFMGEIQ